MRDATSALKPGVIVLSEASKKYGTATAIDSINLSIADGEFLTLLGPSGSGKSTTLGLISGFISPDKGDIFINGARANRTPPHKRNLGVVFQNYALFPHMSVFRNVSFGLEERRIGGAQRISMVRDALESVHMLEYADRYPKQLSGGQQQRVALARAIVTKPSALLLDEPLGALDRNLRDWLQRLIASIHRELGSTFVYVTHDQEEALALSDRIAVFENGRISQIGTPRELYLKPSNVFVARFIGESTVFNGDIIGVDKNVVSVRSKDGVLKGRFSSDCVKGTCSVIIRPEAISLSRDRDMELTECHANVRGLIEGRSFLGSSIKYYIRLTSGLEMIARLHDTSSPMFFVGESIYASWHKDDALVFGVEVS